MTNAMQLFNYEENEVRVIEIDGQPWFVGKDVASVLGYSDTAKAIRTHCKGVAETSTPSAGGSQIVKIIPERDLYRLIMRSKLPAAEQFEEWVVGEVLPSIRKTGGYGNQVAAHDPLLERLVHTIADDIVPMLKQQFEQTARLVERMTEQNRTLEPKPRRKIRQAEREEIYELSRKGFGPAHIGDSLDINPSTIGCIISRARRDGILQ